MTLWPHRLEQWRPLVANSSTATGVPMTLIAAVMDRESRGGEALTPPGPGGTGDVGHGHGLMQIDDRTWTQFCSDRSRWTDPQANITFGAGVLASYWRAFTQAWPVAIAAYNAGPRRVGRLVIMCPAPSVEQLDLLTTGKDYVSWVLARWHELDGLVDFSDVTGGSSSV